MPKIRSFRVGRVTVYPRGRVWYLRYHENGRRRQVRCGSEKDACRQVAAQVNAQLEAGAPAATSSEAIGLEELRQKWLEYHEHVLRSSVATLDRYRTATDHLLAFVRKAGSNKSVSRFDDAQAEAFVRHLRQSKVSPNGHAHTAKRNLRDKGLKYVLQVCRGLFSFAMKRRHLPPYAENPFGLIQIERMPVEDAKPVVLMTAEQERRFLGACDEWQLPLFATLVFTGLRPGELAHLLLPEDVDLREGWLCVRNKPLLGWQVKTRNERRVPLLPELTEVLGLLTAGRCSCAAGSYAGTCPISRGRGRSWRRRPGGGRRRCEREARNSGGAGKPGRSAACGRRPAPSRKTGCVTSSCA